MREVLRYLTFPLILSVAASCSTSDGTTPSTNVTVPDAGGDSGSEASSPSGNGGVGDAGSPESDASVLAAPVRLAYASTLLTCQKGVPCSLAAPTSKGGAVDSYAMVPDLPLGLMFDTSTGEITGTPAAVAALASYTITATNAAGSTSTTLGVVVNDQAPGAVQYGQSSLVCTKGTPCSLPAPTINGGGSVTGFSTLAPLPAGLALDSATGAISGTPTAVTQKVTFTVHAKGSGGGATTTVDITVNDVAPSALSYASSSLTCVKNQPCVLAPPTNAGGAVVSFAVSPALPSGLSLDTQTGAIFGVATNTTPIGLYTVTATNTGGSTNAILTMSVMDTPPGNLVYPSTSLSCTQGTPCSLGAPTSSGQVTFSVTPALPAGLTLNTSTGAISGTPTAPATSANYTVTATSTGGTSTATVTISVAAPLAVTSFAPASGSPGATVTVTGTGFDLTAANNLVTIGGVTATVTAATATTLTVTVPASAVSGTIAVTTPRGTQSSASAFVVPVKVTSFTPNWGAAGTTVQVLGSGFGATNATVTINGFAATVATVTPTALTVTVPAGAAGGKVTVTVGGQSGSSATNFLAGNIALAAGTGVGSALPPNTLATNWPLYYGALNAQLAGKLLVGGYLTGALYSVDLTNGKLTTVAGQRGIQWPVAWLGQPTGTGPAANTGVFGVTGLATASNGDIYYADSYNYLIRKISNGIVTTIAGSGSSTSGGDGGSALNAGINVPRGLALDETGGFLYFIEANRIRRIVLSTGIISTIAGNGTATCAADGTAATSTVNLSILYQNLALDSARNLYVAETSCSRVRKINVTTGAMTTVAGTGTAGFSGDSGAATSAMFSGPYGVAFDAQDNMYIADTGNARIRKIDAATQKISTIAGTGVSNVPSPDGGQATSSPITLPRNIAVDASGNVYFHTDDMRVRKVDSSGVLTTVAGGKLYIDSATDPKSAVFAQPWMLASDPSGNIFVADFNARAIRRLSADGTSVSTVAGTGHAVTYDSTALGTDVGAPYSVLLNAAGTSFWSNTGSSVFRIDPGGTIGRVVGTGTGGSTGDGGLAVSATINAIGGQMALDAAGNFYIADTSNHVVRRVDSSGIITRVAGTIGTATSTGDGGLATAATLNTPIGIAFDSAGRLYIAEGLGNRIRRVDMTTGIITTFAGSIVGFVGDGLPATLAQFSYPRQISFDASGNLYVADGDNHAIRVIDTLGIVRTFAGDSTGANGYGYAGDGGKATAAKFWRPRGVVADPNGVVYIADSNNNVIRKVN